MPSTARRAGPSGQCSVRAPLAGACGSWRTRALTRGHGTRSGGTRPGSHPATPALPSTSCVCACST
eukprot:9469216-Pyramimonas_sp.AAC.1